MNKTRKIPVRPFFRVLAGLLGIACIWAMFFKPAFYLGDWYFLLCWLTMTPLLLACALTGEMPSFLVGLMDDEMFELWLNPSPLLFKFNAASIVGGAVAIFLVLFAIYRAS